MATKTRKEIFDLLSQNFFQMRNDYGVEKMGVLGSFARGEQGPESDVDILVEFSHPVGMIDFIRIENRLRDLLGIKVDLVTRNALKKNIGQRILNEVQYVN